MIKIIIATPKGEILNKDVNSIVIDCDCGQIGVLTNRLPLLTKITKGYVKINSNEIEYAVAGAREKYRIASENVTKETVVQQLIKKFPDDKILVIGQYLSQLDKLSKLLDAPIITGKTPNAERDKIYNDFRSGKIKVLVVSKVANFAIDLPDASMAIQVSGTFGSRQEEAQRLGRILRPKERTSRFFTLITRNTVEEDFGSNRQKFLAEQGYAYKIIRYTEESDLDEITLDSERITCS